MPSKESCETRKTQAGDEALVGYIYLQLRLDTLYCEFAFIAAVKSMSDCFEESVAVQKRFLQFARKTKATATLFFDEHKIGRSFALVSDMNHRIQITVEPFIDLVAEFKKVVVPPLQSVHE